MVVRGIGLLAAGLLLQGQESTAPTTRFGPVWPAGWIDTVRCEGIVEGWAADQRHPEKTFQVVVTVDGKPIGSGTAGIYRRDLDEGLEFGQGRYGFAVTLPKHYLDDRQDHSISGYVVGTKHKLNGSATFNGKVCDPQEDHAL